MKPSTFDVFDIKSYYKSIQENDLTTALTLSLELPMDDALLNNLPWKAVDTLDVDALARRSSNASSSMVELFIHQPQIYSQAYETIRDVKGSYDLMSLRHVQEELSDSLNEMWFKNTPFTTHHAEILLRINEHVHFTEKIRTLAVKHHSSCGLNYLLAKKLQLFNFDHRMPREDVYRLMREFNNNYYATQFNAIAQSAHQYFPDILENFIEVSLNDAIQKDENFERYQSAWFFLAQLDQRYKQQMLERLRPEATQQNEFYYLYLMLGICDTSDELLIQEVLINNQTPLWAWPPTLMKNFSHLNSVTQQLLISHTTTSYILEHKGFGILPPQYIEAIRQGLATKDESIEQWKKDIICELTPFLHEGPLHHVIGEDNLLVETTLFTM